MPIPHKLRKLGRVSVSVKIVLKSTDASCVHYDGAPSANFRKTLHVYRALQKDIQHSSPPSFETPLVNDLYLDF